MNLKINDDLLNRLKDHNKETSFKDVDELIEYILEKYLSENSQQIPNDDLSIPDKLNQRLKDLGYL